MQHTVEQLIKKINAMHDKALELHRERNKYSKLSDNPYDKSLCNHAGTDTTNGFRNCLR